MRKIVLLSIFLLNLLSVKAQVVIYQQNFDGNNGTFSNALLSQVTPNNGWITNTTATQYLNYRHLWNVSTLGTDVSAPITSRSLGIGFFNANTPFTSNNPFRTWSGTNCSVIPVTYRWAYVPVSTVGYENIEVEFKWRCSGESDASFIYDYGTVITSINGGANWLMDETGGTGGTTSYDGTYAGGLYYGNSSVQTQTISLPASRDNQANFALGFRMVIDECYGTGGGFIIDDIIVRGTPIGGCAGGTASPAYQFVETGNQAVVSISGYSGTNIQWQISPDGIGSWSSVSGGLGANSDSYTTAALSNGTYYYRAEVTSSGCTDYSSVAEVYVAAEPNYCSGLGVGGSYLNNHIEDMLFHEWSDPFPGYLGGNYYDYSDTNSFGYATVVANQYHHFAATIRANGTGTASTTVAAWIDFNNDGVFDNTPFSSGGELLDIVNFSSTVGNTYAAYFTVPSAISGLRRMRVRALRGNFASIDPCGNYTNSQTKDLTIKVLPTIGSQVCGTVNGSADVVNANSTADKVYISRVLIEGPNGTVIDNNGQFFGVQAGATVTMYNYSNMMGAFSNGLNLEAGQDYTITIEHSGYTCAAGVFIDYNGDGDFADTDELVGRQSDPNLNPFVFNFTVPTTVTDGQEVALRVRLRYDDLGNLGSVINSCNNINDGLQQYSEVEDYRALLLSPTLVCDQVSNLDASVGAPANGLNHHLDVDWDGLSGATNYDVEVSTDGSSFGSLQNVNTSSFDFNAGDNPNMPYWFRVRARDASQTCAWTTMSSPVYTACDVPAAPNVSNAAATTLDVALPAESPVANPSYTEYSILCPGNGLYVQGDGTLGATEVFQTAAAWGTTTVTGLSTETEYCFVASARNVDGHVVGGINQVSATETFTTNVLNTTAGSGPTNVWWSPSSCTTGGMIYFASGGCPGGNVGFDGSFNSFYGCFLRSPAQNCTGLNSVIMTFDLSNSYFASQPGDRVYFNMWAPTAAQPGGTYIAASKVNGVSTDELFFSVLRNCENVEVEFDLSTVTDKTAILFYLNASCAYNNSNFFSVRYDNITLLEGSPGTCLSTTAAPFPDLVIESITPAAPTVCGSGNVDFDVVVKNNGTVDINAGNSFDVQASVGVNDCSVSSQTQSISTGLAAGASTTLTFSLPISGSGLVSFQADASNSITEGNESNNCLSDNSVIISSGLSGTYTINSGGDYTTVSAAAAALIAQGVCGPVIFDVTGTFNEHVLLTAVTGVSAVNTITFRSASANPATAVIQQSGNFYTFELSGAQYVTLQDLTVSYTGTSTSYSAVRLRLNADNNTIRGCNLNAITTATSTANAGAVIFAQESSAANDLSNILIENNQLTGGTHGIFLDMSSSDPGGLVVQGNTITNFNRGRGIYVTDHSEAVIHGNTISNNQVGGASSYGISVNGGTGPHQITSNYIFTTGTGQMGYGIYLGTPSSSGNNSLCANNSVQIQNAASVAYGIDQPSTNGNFWDIIHNTVYISGGTSSSTFCYRSFTFNDESRILNNVFINAATNTGSSSNQTIQINNATGFAAIDNNCYWTVNTGTPFRGDYVSFYNTWAAFIAATGETNSINEDPQMVFTAGVGWAATSFSLQGAGVYQSNVSSDINGTVRPDPPTMGAHESNIACPTPDITFTVADICPEAGAFVIDYSATSNNPVTYSVTAASPALAGFSNVVNQALPAAPGQLSVSIPNPSSAGTYGFTIRVESAGCSSSELPFSLSILNTTPGTWLGYTVDWETPSNWACGAIPDLLTDVVIPSVPTGGEYPQIASNSIALARNLTIASAASVTMQPGSDLSLTGDFQNSGAADLGYGTIYLVGNTLQTIGGITQTIFNNVQLISAITGEALKLEYDIELRGTLYMNQGKFNLDDYSVYMGTTGVVSNESNTARIYGATGELKTDRVLAANSTYNNIAGIGISITTGAVSPGATIIERGFASQEAGTVNNSIQRYFDIEPSTNTALDATLRMNYFDDELTDTDGVNPNETDLIPWRSEDAGATWEGQFYPAQISRDVAANWVELNQIPAFSRWTLSDWQTEPLPVELLSFTATAVEEAVHLEWITATETNNDFFSIERSQDAKLFEEILKKPGAGNSVLPLEYEAFDTAPLQGVSYYRLRQTDFNGASDVSPVVAVRFDGSSDRLQAFRNVKGKLALRSELEESGTYAIEVFSLSGKLLYRNQIEVSEGLRVSDSGFRLPANSIYLVRVTGIENETVKVFKLY